VVQHITPVSGMGEEKGKEGVGQRAVKQKAGLLSADADQPCPLDCCPQAQLQCDMPFTE
jgi:hypothetical protein